MTSALRTAAARIFREQVITESEIALGEKLEIEFRRISLHGVEVSGPAMRHRYEAAMRLYIESPSDEHFRRLKAVMLEGAAFSENLLLQAIAHRSLVDFTRSRVVPWLLPVIERTAQREMKRTPVANKSKRWATRWAAPVAALQELHSNCLAPQSEPVSPEMLLIRFCAALFAEPAAARGERK